MPPQSWTHRYLLTGTTKWIFQPSEDSRRNGLLIKEEVEGIWSPPYFYYHLAQGGHLKAIKAHLKNTYFTRFDIQNFFGSINQSRIIRTLKKPLGYARAKEIASISTVVDPNNTLRKLILPFGFIQSSLIASICLDQSNLGLYLRELAKKRKITVSVYVDDIIISTSSKDALEAISNKFEEIAIQSNWALSKTKQQKFVSCVSAFNISLSHQNLQIENQRIADFRSTFLSTQNEKIKKGILNYINSVNPSQQSEVNDA